MVQKFKISTFCPNYKSCKILLIKSLITFKKGITLCFFKWHFKILMPNYNFIIDFTFIFSLLLLSINFKPKSNYVNIYKINNWKVNNSIRVLEISFRQIIITWRNLLIYPFLWKFTWILFGLKSMLITLEKSSL